MNFEINIDSVSTLGRTANSWNRFKNRVFSTSLNGGIDFLIFCPVPLKE